MIFLEEREIACMQIQRESLQRYYFFSNTQEKLQGLLYFFK